MAAKKMSIFIFISLLIILFSCRVQSDQVAKLIYEDLKSVAPCVLLTNATHQIGCTSSIGGHVGVVHFIKSQKDVDWLLTDGTHTPYIALFTSDMFKEDIIRELVEKDVINGALVIFAGPDGKAPEKGFSPDYPCPNDAFGMYSSNDDYKGCKKQSWNPQGNGMSFMYYGIPIFAMFKQSEVDILIKCYEQHNSPANGSVPEYPLCSVELKDFMFAAKDTPTCMRKSDIPNPTPNMFCDPLGDLNIWGTLYPLTSTPKEKEIVVVAAKLDSSSFFHDLVHGADNDVSGVIALLAAAKALGDAKRNGTVAEPKNPIMFALFHGESWDYIGSSRMVYEMEKGIFPPNPWKVPGDSGKMDKNITISLPHIKYFIELNQVGLGGDSLWAHTDPLSRTNAGVNKEVETLIAALQTSAKNASNITIKDAGKDKPLPPASFQRFLMSNKEIPGVVLTDHEDQFTNKYYNSRFDDSFNVHGNFKPGNDSKIYLSNNFTKRLTNVANTVANALYTLANDGKPPSQPFEVDQFLIGHLVYCSFLRGNCSLYQEAFKRKDANKLPHAPMSRYISVNTANDTFTIVTNRLLLYFTGYHLEPSATCSTDGPHVMKKMKGPSNSSHTSDICVNGSVYFSTAVSPAFLLKDYTSTKYSTWAESTWNADLSVRMFLVSSPGSQATALVSGIVIVLFSFALVFFIHRKADQLFTPHDLVTDTE